MPLSRTRIERDIENKLRTSEDEGEWVTYCINNGKKTTKEFYDSIEDALKGLWVKIVSKNKPKDVKKATYIEWLKNSPALGKELNTKEIIRLYAGEETDLTVSKILQGRNLNILLEKLSLKKTTKFTGDAFSMSLGVGYDEPLESDRAYSPGKLFNFDALPFFLDNDIKNLLHFNIVIHKDKIDILDSKYLIKTIKIEDKKDKIDLEILSTIVQIIKDSGLPKEIKNKLFAAAKGENDFLDYLESEKEKFYSEELYSIFVIPYLRDIKQYREMKDKVKHIIDFSALAQNPIKYYRRPSKFNTEVSNEYIKQPYGSVINARTYLENPLDNNYRIIINMDPMYIVYVITNNVEEFKKLYGDRYSDFTSDGILDGTIGIARKLLDIDGNGIRIENVTKEILQLTAKGFQKLINENPGMMVMVLKDIWKEDIMENIKKYLKIPEEYKENLETLGDLAELGF